MCFCFLLVLKGINHYYWNMPIRIYVLFSLVGLQGSYHYYWNMLIIICVLFVSVGFKVKLSLLLEYACKNICVLTLLAQLSLVGFKGNLLPLLEHVLVFPRVRRKPTWVWLKSNRTGYAGFGPCFHLPGQAILVPVF